MVVKLTGVSALVSLDTEARSSAPISVRAGLARVVTAARSLPR